MGHVYAIVAVYTLYLRANLTPLRLVLSILQYLPVTVAVIWVTSTGKDPRPLAYVSIGVVMMAMWTWTVFRTGWALTEEYLDRTLDHTMMSRSPLIVVMFGKASALITTSIPAGAVAFLMVPVVTRDSIAVGSPVLLIVSVLLTIVTVLIVSFAFTPLFALAKGRAGFFNAVSPFVIVISGFVYPISQLSSEVQIMARFLPTSWAMESVIHSMEPGNSMARIAVDWGVSLALSLLTALVTYAMFRAVEMRMRVVGSLW